MAKRTRSNRSTKRRRTKSRRGRTKTRRRRTKSRRGRRRRTKSRRRRTKRGRSTRSCVPGPNKKFAKRVDGKCVRFGDPNMTIKKNKPGRKKSFCARHRCSQKTKRATPGYQSCKKWNCRVGR